MSIDFWDYTPDRYRHINQFIDAVEAVRAQGQETADLRISESTIRAILKRNKLKKTRRSYNGKHRALYDYETLMPFVSFNSASGNFAFYPAIWDNKKLSYYFISNSFAGAQETWITHI